MDFLNNLTGGNKQHGTAGEAQTVARPQDTTTTEHKESGGFLSGLSSKMNEAAGGGRKSEANEGAQRTYPLVIGYLLIMVWWGVS
jgi:hypothetical protein